MFIILAYDYTMIIIHGWSTLGDVESQVYPGVLALFREITAQRSAKQREKPPKAMGNGTGTPAPLGFDGWYALRWIRCPGLLHRNVERCRESGHYMVKTCENKTSNMWKHVTSWRWTTWDIVHADTLKLEDVWRPGSETLYSLPLAMTCCRLLQQDQQFGHLLCARSQHFTKLKSSTKHTWSITSNVCTTCTWSKSNITNASWANVDYTLPGWNCSKKCRCTTVQTSEA